MNATQEDWQRLFDTWPARVGYGWLYNIDNGLSCVVGHMGHTQGLTNDDLRKVSSYLPISDFWQIHDGIISSLWFINDRFKYESPEDRSARMLEHMRGLYEELTAN